MERIFRIEPSWDKQQDPKGNFGISDATLWLGVKDKDSKSAVIVKINTGWFLQSIVKEKGNLLMSLFGYPNSNSVSYHKSASLEDYESDDCEWIGGCCNFDVTSTNAEELAKLLISEGSEAVYERLEELYKNRFIKRE